MYIFQGTQSLEPSRHIGLVNLGMAALTKERGGEYSIDTEKALAHSRNYSYLLDVFGPILEHHLIPTHILPDLPCIKGSISAIPCYSPLGG